MPLEKSFVVLWRGLDQPRTARRAVFVLLAIHFGLLAYSAYVHSPTLNEPGHLVAGLSHWKFGRFELYRVNPPLVRMIASLPVAVVGYEEDWTGFYESPGARPVFGMGEDFVAANGGRSLFLLMIARWACIPLSWAGAITCYLWARDLYGQQAGVMACTLWCFSPNILAHASLITADVGGTALGVAACYTFWRWLKNPTWTQAALTGVVLGLAELAKTTLILFYPLWPVLWVVYRWPDRTKMAMQDWLREAGMLSLRMIIGIYVLNLGYGFEGSGTQIKEFHFVSQLFTGPKASDESRQKGGGQQIMGSEQSDPLALANNRFADTLLANIPVPFPKNYLLGIDIQQRDFEGYGRPSYLRGQWQDHGWWYYYLYAGLIKIPLGTLLLGVYTLGIHVRQLLRRNGRQPIDVPLWRDTLILLTPPVLIFAVVSSKTGFSEHFRYALPCFPFAFIWIGSLSSRCRKTEDTFRNFGLNEEKEKRYSLYCLAKKHCMWPIQLASRPLRRAWLILNSLPTAFKAPSKKEHQIELGRKFLKKDGFCENIASDCLPGCAYSLVVIWSIASSLWIYPHSLSYFNELIGGPLNGADHLLGSNVDWGQDLLYVEEWQVRHLKTINLAYFGYFDPSIAHSSDSLYPLDPKRSAISVNFVYGDPWAPRGANQGSEHDWNAILDLNEINRNRITYAIILLAH